ncbi:hypothetical protein BC628DRAFT_116000 [Trametes gibbosa]|nr:hypothetical protein BC628DRAFT_116000 [Trametes gibbosa]
MRSPVIAFSLLAAAVSPALVSGAPTSPQLENAIAHPENAAHVVHGIRSFSAITGEIEHAVGGSPAAAAAPPAHSDDPVHRTQAMRLAKAQAESGQGPIKAAAMPAAATPKVKRAGDQGTAGGNAYSGAASDSSGGDVENDASGGTLTNADGSNPAGGAGSSFSGFSKGGNGNGHGPGGNAYTGATGASRGGNVYNTVEGDPAAGEEDVAMDNTTANNAGGGGFSESGTAEGGRFSAHRHYSYAQASW